MITFLIAVGTFLGGAAAAVGTYFGWRHHQQAKRLDISDMASELQVHRTDDQIAAAIKTALQPLWRSIEANTQLTQGINDRVTRIEAQFGDNGGGLREQVNTTDRRVARIEGHLGIAS